MVTSRSTYAQRLDLGTYTLMITTYLLVEDRCLVSFRQLSSERGADDYEQGRWVSWHIH